MPLFVNYFKEKFQEPITIISPDAGVRRATTFAKIWRLTLVLYTRREIQRYIMKLKHLQLSVKSKITRILFDDIIDTGGTIAAASRAN